MNEDAVSGPALCAVDITVAETTHKKSQTPSDPNSLTLVGNKSAEGILLLNKLPICDDGWNIEAAHVACRQLGFGRALQATQTNQASSDEFSLDDVKCRGNESLLTDCSHLVGRKENCNSGEAAGVVCDARSKDELRREADQRTEECFAKNVLFGPELNSDVWVRPTVLDCQEICSGTEGCGTFSYDSSSMECRLHRVREAGASGGQTIPLGSPGIWKQLNDAGCYGPCGSKGGLCEDFCGHKGYCCRKGYDDCPVLAASVSPIHHTCVHLGGNHEN